MKLGFKLSYARVSEVAVRERKLTTVEVNKSSFLFGLRNRGVVKLQAEGFPGVQAVFKSKLIVESSDILNLVESQLVLISKLLPQRQSKQNPVKSALNQLKLLA
jgi:hypothetical protein